jgi:PAS domain S-box-containing protein
MIGVVGTARDVTENKKAEQKLRESEANLKAIIENSLENIWSINTKYEIHYINAVFASAFEQTFGLILTQGSNVIEALPDSIRTIWKKRYDKALSGEQFFFQEKISAGEFPIYIHVAMNPIRVDATVVGVSVFGRDITEQILAEKKLIEAKEKAEQSDRLKTAFINNITHEIRTPLNGILGFGQIMAETDLTIKERMEYLKTLQSSSNRLLQTVTDFMDISMLTSGNMEVNKTNIQLNVFMDELYQRTKSLCTKKEVVVNLDLPDNSNDFVVVSDRELLRKALNHLLGNSEKFTLQGSIVTGYRVKDNTLTFFVKDTGVGISKEKMKSMFNVFMQGDTSITRGYEGSGLGLSIAKRIITLLGGEIWAESETGTGTTFYISLADPVTEAKNNPMQTPVLRKSNAGKPLILVAEDDESNSFYIKVVLEKSGYATLRVNNGVDAVKSCRSNKEICLVLMDIKMPEMNGIEATKAIREFQPDLPVIALTAYAHSNDEHRIMEAGCTSFLSKPVKKEELLKMLSGLLPGNLQQ